MKLCARARSSVQSKCMADWCTHRLAGLQNISGVPLLLRAGVQPPTHLMMGLNSPRYCSVSMPCTSGTFRLYPRPCAVWFGGSGRQRTARWPAGWWFWVKQQLRWVHGPEPIQANEYKKKQIRAHLVLRNSSSEPVGSKAERLPCRLDG